MYNTLVLIFKIKFTAVISAQEYTVTAEFKVNFIITQRTNIAVFIGYFNINVCNVIAVSFKSVCIGVKC